MKTPYAYIGVKDGMWAAVLAHDSGGDTEKQQKWLRDRVGPTLGEWMADGLEVVTTYSRDEYKATIQALPMWVNPQAEMFA